jgi:2-oxoglutarate ferredoxin oxidoreductase subunit gamma
MRYEVRIIGSAGQGSILASVVLATASAEEGLYATQTATYGAAMRSGVSHGDVVISDGPIDFPKTTDLNAVIVQSQEAYEHMALSSNQHDRLSATREGAVVIVDKDLVSWNLPETYRVIPAPMARVAAEGLGRRQVMNIVALGVLQVATGIHFGKPLISEDAFLRAIAKSVPSRFVELNKKAFLEGVRLAREATA